ncbi:hypothetical protein EYF80_066876 [Liparis tanakae]|uniref:Uncharacterized protein n=1 Tax=Liparis tanakae TaxID=230148 RepID=A0A4Z2E2N8_9TELE|nr:hypothetical protein EYF80_066876 [Liparis tanakae]
MRSHVQVDQHQPPELDSKEFLLVSPDNFYKVEGAKDALICGNSGDAG